MKTKITLVLLSLLATTILSQAQQRNLKNPCKGSSIAYSSSPVVKTIDISPSVTLEYVEQGCEDGIPVILLHGFTDSWHSYEMILPLLPEKLHVYALTLRGHGNSSKPKEGYQPEDFSKDIAVFIKQLAINKPVIVGHSMGSTIAQHFAVNYANLTRGIVLAASFADYNSTAVSDFKFMIDQLTDPIDPAFAEGFQRGTAVRPVPEPMMKTFIEETSRVPAYVWKSVAAGWASSNFAKPLQSYKKPALIIWGNKDGFCRREDQELLLSSIKRSSLKIYEGTGHAVHWEEPTRFANDLLQFILRIR
jgi:non-heme chloroperoxidase